MHEEAGHMSRRRSRRELAFSIGPTLVVLIVSTSLMIGVFAALYIGFLRGKPPQLAASSSFIQDQ